MATRLGRAAGEATGDGGARGSGGQARGRPPRFAKAPTTASIIGWTGLSAFVPGAAHLRAGRRKIGYTLLGVFVALLAGTVVAGLIISKNVGFAAKNSTLVGITVLAGVGALAWFTLVLTSYISLGPDRLPQRGQIVSGIVVGVLCVTVMAPFALTASSVQTARQLTNDIFQPSQGGAAAAAPVKQDDPWNGRRRVNFLLIGGDAAGNREGVRTDSMTVASVNTVTGATVMFSLPRNLQFVRFPRTSPLAAKFPNGFTGDSGQGLLNEVWEYTELHPEVQRGGRYKGSDALKDAIGNTLGLKIDYYALVDMFGFAALVDAIGGLKIRVESDVKWGGHFGTAGTIKAGYRKLNGEEVLWYGRSRVNSDDFSRMSRQRCVIGALAQQATPATVLTNFTRIAKAAKRLFRTDIPRDLLEHLVDLGLKVKDAKITSLQFVPPIIYTGNPDWHKIRLLTAKALREAAQPSRAALAAEGTATPTGSASGATPLPSGTVSPTGTVSASGTPGTASTPRGSVKPRQTPTPNDATGAGAKAAQSLDQLCGF